MDSSGSLTRHGVVDPEKFFQKYEAIKEDYDALRKRHADLSALHSQTVNNLELSQEEVSRGKKLLEEAVRERNGLKQQCTAAIRQWDSALRELNEYKEALGKVQQQHEEAMKEINQAMAVRIKTNKEIKRLTEERDAALQEYSLIMSERDSVHRELEKLTDDLAQAKKQNKSLEAQNKELSDKVTEAVQEADVSKRRRDWAFSERDKIVRERESLRTLCDRLRRERDRAVSDLAEALSESEDIKKQKNLASKQLKELRERIEFEKENRSIRVLQLSNSSSFSESRDSAIDSDMPSGHYSIKLPNARGADHGLVLEPGVYISRIVPGSPAAKDSSLSIGDRVLFINDTPIDNVQDAILALSEDIDPIMLTLSRSVGHLASPLNTTKLGSLPPQLKQSGNQNQGQQNPMSHNSTSSLKSDKSETSAHRNNNIGNQSHSSSRNRPKKTRLTNIFGVKLPNRKKLSSPEEAILATLDSAIDSGAGSTGAQRKIRKKRSGRGGNVNSSDLFDSSNRGTWPRVLAHRNNNSYTLPHNVVNVGHHNDMNASMNQPSSVNRETEPSQSSNMHHNRDASSIYDPYGTTNPRQSNTVCVRHKERVPITSLTWDSLAAHPAKSVGAIVQSGSSNKSPNSRYSDIVSLKALGIATSSILQPPYHRYSCGVFDSPANTQGKIGKGMPERNSVVPTFTISDGSSIDFSVKSGNEDMLDYYVKRMAKNQNNSSESDHLDKVVTPPSLAIANIPVGAGSSSSAGRNHISSQYPVCGPVTLDKFANPFATIASPNPRYSLHHHDLGGIQLPLTSSKSVSGCSSGAVPLSMALPNPGGSYSFEPSFQHNHSHGGNSGAGSSNVEPSISVASTLGGGPRGKINYFRNSDDLLLHPSYPLESSGTFPRNREPQRIRIPSNQSVTSRSSAEKFEIHNSPMPTYHIEVLDPGTGARGGDYGTWPRKPASGELRKVRIDKYDKSTEPLGIQISCKSNGGGVFVSSVSENSLASQVGLQIGDQLLEVCGINMRSATYNLAANVLRQCGDSITMLVQYSPDKYREEGYDDDNSSSGRDSNSQSDDECSSEHDEENNSSMSENESHSSARSGSPTPCNSPQSTLVRNSKKNVMRGNNGAGNASSSVSNQGQSTSQIMNKLGNITINGTASLKKNQIPPGMVMNPENQKLPSQQQMHQQQSQQQQAAPVYSQTVAVTSDSKQHDHQSTLRSSMRESNSSEPRLITLSLMKNSANLGICLVGGNVVGIFVHSVQQDSIADRAGLRTGDQLMEYNGTDLRQATAEEAAFELAKPLEKVMVLVQYNMQRYNEIKDQPGDGFYIRALFDFPSLSTDQHSVSNSDSQELSFHKDEILYVDNTMFNGKPGRWRAWKVDSEGHRRTWGIIPSKYKVEEDLMFKRSLGDMDGDRRTSTITRRSFFRRKSQHRSSSRELASFSDFSINSYGDLSQNGSLQLKDDSSSLALTSYQRVERLEYMLFLRPVLIIGGLCDVIIERLIQDFPYQFGRNIPEIMHCSGPMLEKGLAENIFVDYKRKGSHYECVTMQAIKEISSKKLHCILDISTAGVERLQRAQMYPIVLMIKFKSAKQIREIKDLRGDKITAKAAKELFEHSQKVESEYKHVITASIPGGTNISYLATQAKTAIDKEQSTTLWVPA